MKYAPKKHHLLGLLPDAWVQTHGPRSGACRYLTFDDGPHPEHTPQLLDLLRRHGLRASFFVVGQRVERHPDIARRIVDEGHLLGNHSHCHTQFGQMDLATQVSEIAQADRVLQGVDGCPRHRVRTPQGHLSWSLLRHFARERRSVAYWCYDSLDYRASDAATLVERLGHQPPRAGDIVLMHDDSQHAVDALEQLLPQWLAAGWTFDALAQDRA
ncbi:polysaccharide deacetylase family protein [Dyella sp.]|jgi:peptidoglycan/xylan/chitin deacetylase (PgdA/CDA1 family)|uniref:polysaccharide deacetylase family protein n=1 Tax=Dyella sp. TaxID=1869338 RepID=UPI002D78D728|nr:polysaccharide deacetylase family protein [Dyella sp.]HET6432962.1 polysaccharide deacetylase family protein [Dyella sp.]